MTDRPDGPWGAPSGGVDEEVRAAWRPWWRRLRMVTAALVALALALTAGVLAAGGRMPVDAWNRVGSSTALAGFYAFLVHRLGRGSARALLRLHVSVGLGLVVTTVVTVLPGDLPGWFRAEQALQLALLVVLAVILRRPQVRAAFPGWTRTRWARRRERRRTRRAERDRAVGS